MFGINGNIDFIEVDGIKFEADAEGKAKVGSDGKNIPFVEVKPPVPPIVTPPDDLTELAKSNPALARILQEKADAEIKLANLLKESDDKKRTDAEKQGEWKKLYDETLKGKTEVEGKLTGREDIITKLKSTVKTVLDMAVAQIPKDRLSLIPTQFTEREKLEYIFANAKLLGVNPLGGTGGVPPNEQDPNVTDEDKLVKEFEELQKKANKTQADYDLMYQKATKLKELRTKKASAK